ncbi:DUF5808 domain-containing protein [Clostridium sp. AL.422]|uniref:DUF5808 domain-containing protein n=1 Tax=Clostridium TaxID=1485 RepID=UPI00293DAE00|nr:MULTISPECIES: DUF5808 domain-containing protein [unclassified Clostridium]MDV4149824.1 DUF5808 domain-containing protein [Clostridium sp. AL.422]
MNNIESIIVFNITIISLGILSYYINSFSNSGIYFGIRIPKIFKDKKELKDLEREYKRVVLLAFSILVVVLNIVLFIFISSSEEVIALIIGVTTIISVVLYSIIYFIYNIRLKKLKEKNNWNYEGNNVVIVDTTLRKPKKDEKYKALNDWIFLIPMILPIILLVLTYIRREDLINYETFEIYKFPIIGIIMCLFIYLLAKISLRARVDLNSTNIESTIKYKKKIKRLISLFLLASEVGVIILYSIIQLGIIYNFYSSRLILYINILVTIIMIIFILVFIKIGMKERDAEEKIDEEEAYKDDDSKWILGMFYYNKNDPAFMIEKRVGLGYTINFANKKSLALSIFIILFITLMSSI